MVKTEKGEADERWFTVGDDATQATSEAAMRAALIVQRDRLAGIDVDVVSDEEWPAAVAAEVRRAERRLGENCRRGVSLHLDPRVDEDFGIALALAPFSINGSGTATHGDLIWDANDTGTSAVFRLTPAETPAVRSAIARAGGHADDLIPLSGHHLRRRNLSYDVVGDTTPAAERWRPPDGWRAYEQTVRLGSGEDVWNEASAAVLSWGVKTRSGFTIDPSLAPGHAAHPGERYWLVAHIGPARVREPVVIVDTVDNPDRVALAYGTLDGHPVAGEEAFIVHRDDHDDVSLTLRSLTRAGRGRRRLLFPVVLIAQRVYRRRYLRALARDRR